MLVLSVSLIVSYRSPYSLRRDTLRPTFDRLKLWLVFGFSAQAFHEVATSRRSCPCPCSSPWCRRWHNFFQVVEPDITTNNHVQVAVPGVLAVVVVERLTRLLVAVPGAGNQRTARGDGICRSRTLTRGIKEGRQDAPGKTQCGQGQVAQKRVFAPERRGHDHVGHGRF